MTISEALLIQVGSVVFFAGIMVNRINTLTTAIKKLEGLPERLAAAETEIKNIKEQMQ